MTTLKFEFKDQGSFKKLAVKTEKMTIIIAKGEPEAITIKGEIVLKQEIDYEVKRDEIVEVIASEGSILIDTSDLEHDLKEQTVDYESFKLYISVPDELKIKAESELGRIIVTGVEANSSFETEMGLILLEDVSGDAKVVAEIGKIKVKRGNFNRLTCTTEIGNIEVIGTMVNELHCESEAGEIVIRKTEISDATIISETGSIEYHLLPVMQNHSKIESGIGKVKLIIPKEINLSLKAISEMGGVNQNLKNVDVQEIENGLILKTVNKSNNQHKAVINISTELGWILLLNDDTPLEKEKSHSSSRLNREINNAMNEINKITRVLSSRTLRKSLGSAFANLGETIKSSVQSALRESDDALKQSVKEMQDSLHQQSQEMKNRTEESRKDAEYQRGNAYRTEERLSDNEKSRLKILELLENGKINQEEAERLLKAIGK